MIRGMGQYDDALPCPAAALMRRLSTRGNQLTARDASSEQPVRLRGVNRSSFQYLPSLRDSGMEDPAAELALWSELWNVDIIRFPVFPDRYLREAAHRAELDQVVLAAASAGIYLILEFHGIQSNYQIGEPTAEALPGWQAFARRYGGLNHVAFDLWNEPHDLSWGRWQRAAQGLVDAIRAEGATETLIVVGGLDWAYDLSPLADPQSRLEGQGPLCYATHPYPFKGGPAHGPQQWEQRFGEVARTLPVLVTEFGADGEGDPFFKDEAAAAAWVESLLAYVDERGLTALAWSGGDRPHLTLGRDGGRVQSPRNPPDLRQPSAFGQIVQRWLRKP